MLMTLAGQEGELAPALFISQISNFKFQISTLKSQIPNPKSQISNLKSQISNLKSQIPNPKSQIPDRPHFPFLEFTCPKIWIFIYVSNSQFQLSRFCLVQKSRRRPTHRTGHPGSRTRRHQVSRLPPSLHEKLCTPSIALYSAKNRNARCVFEPRKVIRLSSDF